MHTIKDFLDNVFDIDNISEMDLIKISDKIWALGSLENIKEEVTPKLFAFHICVNLIGNWKEGGWNYIIAEMGDLVPYIAETLEMFDLGEMKKAFVSLLECFPKDIVFNPSDASYFDIINFLTVKSYKTKSKRLSAISSEERKEIMMTFKKRMKVLDDLTELSWGDNTECFGWKQVLDFIASKCDECE